MLNPRPHLTPDRPYPAEPLRWWQALILFAGLAVLLLIMVMDEKGRGEQDEIARMEAVR